SRVATTEEFLLSGASSPESGTAYIAPTPIDLDASSSEYHQLDKSGKTTFRESGCSGWHEGGTGKTSLIVDGSTLAIRSNESCGIARYVACSSLTIDTVPFE
ncbi:MAG: hypothetical protein VYA80_03165, partial [Pseudomonadota bacterium]|nr:hypothetical protein [Pseudomonadota bacterium]